MSGQSSDNACKAADVPRKGPPVTILLIIGNGLAIDYCAAMVPARQRLDPAAPLDWPTALPALGGRPALEVMPELGVALAFARRITRPGSDFALIDRLSRISAATPEWAPLIDGLARAGGVWGRHLETVSDDAAALDRLGVILRHLLRLFLNAAYLEFARRTREFTTEGWAWATWFAACRDDIGAMVSLNYDTLLERCFTRAAGRPLIYTLFEQDYSAGIPLHKPHGSVNFRNSDRVVALRRTIYDSGLLVDAVDQPPIVTRDPDDPGLTPVLALPGELDSEDHRRRVAHGSRVIAEAAAMADHCIVAGVSYWAPDRPELNAIFNQLRRGTRLTLVNPIRNERLETTLGRRFATVEWLKGPAELLQPAVT